MTRLRRPFLPGVLGVALAIVGAACATPRVTTERRPDGIYHLTCKASLTQCLATAETLCGQQRYAVLRAFDVQDYKGNLIPPEAFHESEAFFRCGGRAAWGDEINDLKKAPVCAEAAPASAQTRGCTPGASVACVGLAGCAGGQVCLPDGARFGPCDCGPPASPPPALATPATP